MSIPYRQPEMYSCSCVNEWYTYTIYWTPRSLVGGYQHFGELTTFIIRVENGSDPFFQNCLQVYTASYFHRLDKLKSYCKRSLRFVQIHIELKTTKKKRIATQALLSARMYRNSKNVCRFLAHWTSWEDRTAVENACFFYRTGQQHSNNKRMLIAN
jgi:hypothetical protein